MPEKSEHEFRNYAYITMEKNFSIYLKLNFDLKFFGIYWHSKNLKLDFTCNMLSFLEKVVSHTPLEIIFHSILLVKTE